MVSPTINSTIISTTRSVNEKMLSKWFAQTIYKKMKEPLDIYTTIFPLYYVCTKAGLAPYKLSFSANQRKYFENCPYKLTKTFLSTVFILTATIYYLVYFKPSLVNNSDQLRYYQEIFSSTIFSCSIIFGCLFVNKIAEAFQIIDDVDVVLKRLAVWIPYKQTQMKILINMSIVGFIIISTFTLLCVSPIIDNESYNHYVVSKLLLQTITSFLPYFINVLMEYQYYHYLDIIRLRYKLLNEYLEILSKEKQNTGRVHDSIVTIGSNINQDKKNKPLLLISGSSTKTIKLLSDPVSIVDQIIALHIKLTNAAHLINYTFCVQQLLRITVAFVGIVTALFWIAVEFSKSSASSSKDGGDLIFTGWAFSNVLEIILIVWITNETCEEIEIYSLQMYHNRLSFTVCGLFPLDYTLLYTIVAGVTTYLVILIQFNNTDFINDEFNNSTTNTTL